MSKEDDLTYSLERQTYAVAKLGRWAKSGMGVHSSSQQGDSLELPRKNDLTPAIILGMDGPASMGVIICLAELGVPLVGVDFTTHRNYAFKSRFLNQMVLLRRDEDLLRLPMVGTAGSVLVPVNDHFVAMTSRMKPQLSKHFRVFTPGERVIRNCVDKWEQYRRAASLGIPTPETYCPHSREELERLLKSKLTAKNSWVVKPRSRLPEHFSKTVFGNQKAILVNSLSKIREICDGRL